MPFCARRFPVVGVLHDAVRPVVVGHHTSWCAAAIAEAAGVAANQRGTGRRSVCGVVAPALPQSEIELRPGSEYIGRGVGDLLVVAPIVAPERYWGYRKEEVLAKSLILKPRGVAQPGSAPALGAGCRGFESLCPDQFYNYRYDLRP